MTASAPIDADHETADPGTATEGPAGGDAGAASGAGTDAGTGAEPDIAELAHRLRLSTARLARLLRQSSGSGLSPSQHSVLVSVYVNKSVTLGELAAIEQVAPPTITKIVAKLEEEGLVTRTVDPRDRRVARISVTDAGRARLAESRDRRNAWLTQRLEERSPEDLRRLADAVAVLESLAGSGPRLPASP